MGKTATQATQIVHMVQGGTAFTEVEVLDALRVALLGGRQFAGYLDDKGRWQIVETIPPRTTGR